ncbi:MAG: hypothetical protein U0R69_02120 [Gaiellales bacterium]
MRSRHASGDPLRAEEIESLWEAAPALGVVIGLQVALALVSRSQQWEEWGASWWIWLVPSLPEACLLLLLTWHRPRRRLAQVGRRHAAALIALGVVSLANSVVLLVVIGSLVTGSHASGAQLLSEALGVWAANVVTFGLWFWSFDRGGPVRRLRPDAPPPDFLFPQMASPELAAPGWSPGFLDYMYVSFTNSIAFSPTDAMPLSRGAKMLMLVGSSLSVLTVVLVAARAVNVLG